MSKKGQGLSLNAIIIAALALIVLVVLVAVFTGQIGKTKAGIEQVGQAKLVTMKISYGDCHPRSSVADTFVVSYNQAVDTVGQDLAETDFNEKIENCKSLAKDACSGECQWK